MVILTVFKQGKLVLLLTSDICKLCFSVQITFWDKQIIANFSLNYGKLFEQMMTLP